MKKAAKLIFGMLLGAAAGFGGVMLIVWLVNLGKEPAATPEEAGEGIDWIFLVLCILMSFIFIGISALVQTVLHEAGHMLGGMATGYRLLSFRVLGWMIARTDTGFSWKRTSNLPGTMGQCIMLPPEGVGADRLPYFWYNAGGVMANLAVLVLSILALRLFQPETVMATFWIMMAIAGLYLALINALPLSINGIGNDGRNILLLRRKEANRQQFILMLLIAGRLSQGERLSAMPREWFEDASLSDADENFAISGQISQMELEEDLGNYDRAREMAERIMAPERKLSGILALEAGGERVMLELMTLRRDDVIKELWTRQQEAYLRSGSKSSPVKLAVLYAHELLSNHDGKKAGEYLSELEERKDIFPMPGESLTALSLCDSISRIWKESANKEEKAV